MYVYRPCSDLVVLCLAYTAPGMRYAPFAEW